MKKIALTQNKFAIVDDSDYEMLSRYKWHVSNQYAVSGNDLRMHRLILKINYLKGRNIQVDHINGDKLDNRKRNLRVCTPSQNKMNCGVTKGNTSGVKGVHWHKEKRKWQSYIKVDGKQIH